MDKSLQTSMCFYHNFSKKTLPAWFRLSVYLSNCWCCYEQEQKLVANLSIMFTEPDAGLITPTPRRDDLSNPVVLPKTFLPASLANDILPAISQSSLQRASWWRLRGNSIWRPTERHGRGRDITSKSHQLAFGYWKIKPTWLLCAPGVLVKEITVCSLFM